MIISSEYFVIPDPALPVIPAPALPVIPAPALPVIPAPESESITYVPGQFPALIDSCLRRKDGFNKCCQKTSSSIPAFVIPAAEPESEDNGRLQDSCLRRNDVAQEV